MQKNIYYQIVFLFLSFISTSTFAFDSDTSSVLPKPKLQSSRISAPPKIDGKLDDAMWQNLPIASLEITYLPEFGKIPSRKTEVKVAYDNNAIYIGAMMYDDDPSLIKTQLSERDGNSSADNFVVGLDTYDDDLNGYRFTVSAAGVQTDQRATLNNNNDLSWDAVWESDIYITENGWMCEIKIPYSAIRFPSKETQDWGLQFARSVNATGEFILWSPVDPKEFGIINQWGALLGLENITPPPRLSFSPYLNAGYQWTAISDDPITYDKAPLLNGGLDVKYGINESFTIDATLIPNFGEVQSDNLILNLSPFEQQFNERRPFFTEGIEIFNQTFSFISDNLFYSRRIGGTPYLYWNASDNLETNEQIIANPSETNLYNATKFSGRTDKNLGIGILNAIATREYATIENTETGETRDVLTNPLTNYNMIVFEQSLKNNSKVSFTNTNTLRDGFYRDANVSQILYDITNKKRTWNYWGFANVSQVYDEKEIADTSTYPVLGANYMLGITKFHEKWNYNFSHALVSKNYDHSDMGIQFGENFMNNFFGINYTNYETDSTSIFSNYNGWTNASYNVQVDPLQYQETSFSIGMNGQLKKSFWNVGGNIFSKPFWYYDFYEPRISGQKYYHAPFVFFNAWWGSDYRKDLVFNWNVSFGESPLPHDPYFGGGQYVSWNLSDKFSLNHGLFLSKDHSNFGQVDFSEDVDGNLINYFGERNVINVDNEIGIKYIFGPKMNILSRARHYWGKVNYIEFYTLNNDGTITNTEDLEGLNYDFNFNIFNIDFVYAWEFAPGSYLNVIWKNNIFQSDDLSKDNYFDNLSKTFATPQNNGLSFKLIYYLDYLYLKKG